MNTSHTTSSSMYALLYALFAMFAFLSSSSLRLGPRSHASSACIRFPSGSRSTAMFLSLLMPASAMVVSNQEHKNNPKVTLAEAASTPSTSTSTTEESKKKRNEQDNDNVNSKKELWETSKGRQFLSETLAKTQGERPTATSMATLATNAVKDLVHKVKERTSNSIGGSGGSSSGGFAGLAASFSAMMSTGNNENRADSLDDIMSQVTTSAQQGQGVTDTAGFSKLLSIMQDNSDKIQQILDKQFGHIDFSYFTPAALWYYLEHEDERKNPSWKRLQHRFHESIDVAVVEELNDDLALSELSYADTFQELKEGLDKLKNNTPLELIYYEMESSPSQPSHFVAVKKGQSWWSSTLEVVIVVRGTKTVSDAITDVIMEEEDYRGGKVHSGILESGRWLAERHGDLCLELLKQSNKRNIQLTLIGHSLGAGAAAIAGMELKDKPNIDVKVVGFGCPALLSKELSESTKDFITTVVCDSDIVPRMSGATVANVALDVMEYDRYPKLLRDAQHAIDALGNYSPMIATKERREAAMKYIEEASDDFKKKLQKPRTEERVSPVLFPPGKCVHFYRDGHSVSGSISPCTFFGEIDITRTMVDDHLISSGYAKIFLDLMRVYHDDEEFSFDEKNDKKE